MQAAAADELPAPIAAAIKAMAVRAGGGATPPDLSGPPQNLREYDPEWGRAFYYGTVAASCDHARMLAGVRTPVLFTHHFRKMDEETGTLMGAISDLQAARVRELVAAAGQPVRYLSFPTMAHSMHGQDPALFTSTVAGWAATLP
jgi:hypothetical protein